MRSNSRSGGRASSRRSSSTSQNEIIINKAAGETRVAILEQGSVSELHIERESGRSVAGMVSKGRVTRVLPGMQAAFVDIGLEKAGFLYVGDYRPENSKDGENGDSSSRSRSRGRNGGSRVLPRIETILKEGQEIMVQVAKEPIGSKGARITSHVSIAGRHLVLTPWSARVGVSRRIDTERERRRLRDIVSRVRPKDVGFIIRTAGDSSTEADIEADVRYLTSVWEDIKAKKATADAPGTLFTELSLPLRVIRDFANGRTKRIVIDDPETHEQMQGFLDRFVADPKPALEHFTDAQPIFDHFGIESRIDENLGKKVWLKSGGHLVVDQSEALTAIDVNTGRYVGKRDLEETVLKTNLEAVKEIVHQLRFRNIGGLIILDLIDMESAENRDKVYRALQEALRHDKAKTNILKISELGLIEMTRKRTRESLVQQLCESCAYCEGRGYVMSGESVAYKLLREIRKDLPKICGRKLAVAVNPDVAEVLLGPARKALATLGEDLGCEIEVRARPGIHQEQFEVSALDEGAPIDIQLSWLRDPKQIAEEEAAAARAEEEARAAAAAAQAEAEAAKQAQAEAKTAERAAAAEAKAAEEAAQESENEPAPLDDDDDLPLGASFFEPEPSEPAAKEEEGPSEDEAPQVLAEETDVPTEPAPEPAPQSDPEPEMVDGEEENPILHRLQNPEESS